MRLDHRSPLQLSLVPTLLLACARGQEEPAERHPLLWRIDGVGTPSYLFGTIHVPDPRVLDLPPVVTEAFAAADRFYAELDMSPGVAVKSIQPMLLPEGEDLQELLPPALYARLDAYLKKHGGDLGSLRKLQIWAVDAQLPLLVDARLNGDPIDRVLYQRARKANKAVAGIETYEEQFAVFQGFTKEEQIEGLEKTLDELETAEREGRDLVEELLTLYLVGDLKKLGEYLDKEIDLTNPREARFHRVLITERDQRMAERMDKEMKAHPGESCFFAFGAAHMAGIRGHLEKRGYHLVRVEPAEEH